MKNENAKHTPGPWIVSSDGKAVRSSADIMANYRRNVVNVGKRDNVEEMSANLALCAAAPELLAALEAIQEAFTHKPGDVKGNKARTAPLKYCNAEFSAALTAIRSAIAKAKGE